MYEEIDLDAIESNKDEAPDYRPFLKSSAPGGPVNIEYRMRYLSTLESEEKSSYQEFAKIADREGMKKIASVFREILQEEKGHADKLADTNNTMMNIRTAIHREKDKIDSIESVMDAAYREKNSGVVAKLKDMLAEEKGHVEKLSDTLAELENEIKEMKKEKNEKPEKQENYCTYGVCVPKIRED